MDIGRRRGSGDDGACPYGWVMLEVEKQVRLDLLSRTKGDYRCGI